MDIRNEATFALAAYFEFRNKDHVFQYILIPETRHPDTGEVVKALSMTRDLTVQHQRRKWKYTDAKEDYVPLSNGTSDLVAEAVNLLKPWAAGFAALLLQDWTLFKTPLVIGIGPDDVKAIARRESTPDGLMRRLANARNKGGFPDVIVEGLAPTGKAEAF